jgi:AcrR family transcriptional regulator
MNEHPPMKSDRPDEGPRWQRRPAKRRREILEAAVQVFGEQGFDGATMVDIAGRAGVCAGTVTHYFGSKAGLFQAALSDRVLEDVEAGEALLARHRGSARDLLKQVVSRIWEHFNHPGTLDLMLFGLAKAQTFPEATGLMCREIGERWRRLLGAVITAGIERGEFRSVDPVLQARIIGTGLFGLLVSVHHFGRFERHPMAPEHLFAQYLDTIDHALSAHSAEAAGSGSMGEGL